MQKKAIRRCAVCLQEEVNVLHHQKFDLPEYHVLPHEYDVVVCKNCGFCFADTSASQHCYNKYYTDLSKYEDEIVSSGSFSEWDQSRYQKVIKRIEPFIGKTSRILDIGCANGGLLSFMIQKGYSNVTGLDPSAKCVSYMKSQDIYAVQGELFENELLEHSEKYDLVIVSHVFEHLRDLERAVSCLNNYLNEDGLIYVETPNAAKYHDYFVVPYYYFDVEHINHFTEQSLSNLFSRGRFDYVQSGQAEIDVAKGKVYPVAYVVFKKGEESFSVESSILAYDPSAEGSIKSYIEASNYSQINEKLIDLSGSQEPCVVWGAGQNTLRLLSDSVLSECNVICFIDKDRSKQGKGLDHVPIVSPSWIISEGYKGTIIISSALFAGDIEDEIQAIGFNNRIIIL